MYQLMLKDIEIVEFTIKNNKYGIEPTVIEKINMSGLLPFGYSNIIKFINSRKPPSNRENYRSILDSLPDGSIESVIEITNCASLNDCYWIKRKDSNMKFANVSLYKNKFSEILQRNAFVGELNKTKTNITTPEFTTNGALRKCWKVLDGVPTLYKSGTFGYANAGNEPYSEFYISEICKDKFNILEYNLEIYEDILCSTCKCFCSENRSFVPIYELIKENIKVKMPIEKLFEARKVFGEDLFDIQIAIDYIFMNVDRHYGNFGLLYIPETKEIVGQAPIFDNGMSLFYNLLDRDFEDREYMDNYFNNTRHSSGLTFEELLEVFLNKNVVEVAEKLRNLKIIKHKHYNLNDKRLESIENLLNKRVENILNSKSDTNTNWI